MTDARSTSRIRPAAAFCLDAAAVIMFVTIGRRSHDETGNPVAGALSVAAPFLLALAFGWLIGRAWRAPVKYRVGTVIWLTTVTLGLAGRRLVFDRGIATAFVIVTTVTLCILMLGWRLAANRFAHRRRTPNAKTSEPARR